ncbi:hypothetical protein BTVI_62208 [Pitangus sulphuratus]|nr:hypothetical protein BTVI_62208 [Pitangus sulphuratus]
MDCKMGMGGSKKRDLDKLEKGAQGNLMGFNKSSARGNPQYQYSLGDEWMKSSPAKKVLEVLEEERLDISQLDMTQPYPEVHQKECGQQVKGASMLQSPKSHVVRKRDTLVLWHDCRILGGETFQMTGEISPLPEASDHAQLAKPSGVQHGVMRKLDFMSIEKGTVKGECLGKPLSIWLLCPGTKQKEEEEDL